MTSHMTNESSRAKALRDAAANVVDRDGCALDLFDLMSAAANSKITMEGA